MALTYSEMVPLASKAPDFSLTGVDGKTYKFSSNQNAKAYVVMFICNHCPYVIAVQDRIAALARMFAEKNVQFFGICSNDSIDYPEDSPVNLKKQAENVGFNFPYLIDETQEVAKNYGAVCTPDFFVFDGEKNLSYRGRLDDSWKDASKVTRKELAIALELILKGGKPDSNQLPSMGCNIKWRKT